MARRLSFLVPSRAIAGAVAALLAGSAGWAIAATSTRSPALIRACASKKTGILRLAAKCRRGEHPVVWNQRGLKGARGSNGATGAIGPAGASGGEGQRGAMGPGASSFQTTIALGEEATLASLANGVTVSGACGGGVRVRIAGSGADLQASGTGSADGSLQAVDLDNSGTFTEPGANTVDIDVVATAGAGKLARIDVHGSLGSPCGYRGMITLSS